jgi:hypothetical protein
MPENKKYNASLTGEPFLFYETRQVARLKLNGLNDKEIMEEVINNNLFQYATEKSIPKRVRAASKRVRVLDENMLEYLLEKSSETAKIINLYAIMKSNRLVMDKKDMNEFFLEKREQSEEVARWQDNTIKKLKQVLLRMLTEAGILDDRDGCTLHRPVLDPEVIRYIEAAGELNLLKAMGITI